MGDHSETLDEMVAGLIRNNLNLMLLNLSNCDIDFTQLPLTFRSCRRSRSLCSINFTNTGVAASYLSNLKARDYP